MPRSGLSQTTQEVCSNRIIQGKRNSDYNDTWETLKEVGNDNDQGHGHNDRTHILCGYTSASYRLPFHL